MRHLSIKLFVKMLLPMFFVYLLGYAWDIGWDGYHTIWWPNRLVHFLGGVSTAIFGYYLLDLVKKFKFINTLNKVVDFFIILIFVMSITVVWEFYEYLSDVYLLTNAQPSVADTMKDMFMGMLGAIVFGIGWAKYIFFKKCKKA